MKEEWLDIEGYEGLYQVSNTGYVRSLKSFVFGRVDITIKIKQPLLKPNGYLSVSLFKDKSEKRYYVHRLVAKAFIENVSNKTDVNHIDGNKQNNRLSNLEWSTRSENIIHAREIGIRKTGENHATSKLSDDQVKFIKDNYKSYDKTNGAHAIAKLFGVSHQLISMIANGKHR